MITPQVHLNGTSRDELTKQMLTVVSSLLAAMENLKEARPHGRDYYHTKNYAEAYEQHQEWEKRVQRTLDEIEQWITELDFWTAKSEDKGTNEC